MKFWLGIKSESFVRSRVAEDSVIKFVFLIQDSPYVGRVASAHPRNRREVRVNVTELRSFRVRQITTISTSGKSCDVGSGQRSFTPWVNRRIRVLDVICERGVSVYCWSPLLALCSYFPSPIAFPSAGSNLPSKAPTSSWSLGARISKLLSFIPGVATEFDTAILRTSNSAFLGSASYR